MLRVVLLFVILGVSPAIEAQETLSFKNQQKLNFMKALTADQVALPVQSEAFYQKLGSTNPNGQEHLFLQGLLNHPFASSPTLRSSVVQVRFLWFNGYLDEAFEVLLSRGLASDGLKLEALRLYLYTGNYGQARAVLDSFYPTDEALVIERLELSSWLSFVQGEQDQLKETEAQLQERLLYLPIQRDPEGVEKRDIRELERWLLLYPRSDTLLEQVTHRYWETSQWGKLSQLCEVQLKYQLMAPAIWVCAVSSQLAKHQPYSQIKAYIVNMKPRIAIYMAVAQRAIQEKNWLELQQVGRDFSADFPQLKDGGNYQIRAVNQLRGD